jgi:hypothetical protein
LRLFWQPQPIFWRSSITLIVVIAIFAGFAAALEQIVGFQITRNWLMGIGIFASIAPTLIWAYSIFRHQDSEGLKGVHSLLPIVFIVAALVAISATIPLSNTLQIEDWLAQSDATQRAIGSILLSGCWHSIITYAILRFIVWESLAFEKRIDALIFALGISLAYSSMLNANFVLENGGLLILSGSLRIFTHTLSFASSQLLMGYCIGVNRFEDFPFYFIPLGFIASTILNGLLLFASSAMNSSNLGISGTGFNPWPGLIVNLLVFGVVLLILNMLLQRHNAQTQARLGILR